MCRCRHDPVLDHVDVIVAGDRKIVHGHPKELPTVYSKELQFLIFNMLEKEPDARPNVNQILSYSAVKIRVRIPLTFPCRLICFFVLFRSGGFSACDCGMFFSRGVGVQMERAKLRKRERMLKQECERREASLRQEFSAEIRALSEELQSRRQEVVRVKMIVVPGLQGFLVSLSTFLD